ncbi:MAG TPA: dihydrofolate reductase family protein [Chitinophagaceae bacterium]|jgi:dihydrofolate reductase|nr:dihydrofolate reductase family protein [Chitinophagaceae bacterium]
MGKLLVYNFVSANGYFKGLNEDISWAHQNPSQEESDFAAENAQGGAVLLFGRKTYEMMVSYWPSPEAKKNNAGVAEGMNKAEKIVFSKTLKKADWNNTRVINDDIIGEVKELKQSGKVMTILGSGSIVNQLAEAGLVDEFQVMIHPVAIGSGTPFLKDINKKIELVLTKTRSFKSGIVLLCYQPKKSS